MSYIRNGDYLEHYFTNNDNLKSELRTIIYKHQGHELMFYSDNGVFSKDKLDFGSTLLLNTLYDNKQHEGIEVLDVGCGYGFMGISLAKILGYKVTMVDVNKRALHLAEKNCDCNKIEAKVLESNMYENVTDIYDSIITNPPIRAGKEIVRKFLKEAYCHLKSSGELWFVMRKDHGVKSIIKELEEIYKISIMNKSKGFYIVKCIKK